MHLLLLASLNPQFGHAKAGYIVLASLLEALALSGHQVSYATVCCHNPPDEATLVRLREAGVKFVGDFTDQVVTSDPAASALRSDIRTVRKAFLSLESDDLPYFAAPAEVIAELQESGADATLIFWDTWFEHLLTNWHGTPIYGYLARPRYASPLARIAAMDAENGGIATILRQSVLKRLIERQRDRHNKRIRVLKRVANICALDAAEYRQLGVKCEYVPNTWPDFFGADWKKRRTGAEHTRARVGILGNIGDLTGTGNLFGVSYLAEQILPRLRQHRVGGWDINLCGRGILPDKVAGLLDAEQVNLKGFVDDIDGEVLANRIFLLLNNAGPYTGGYTRVIYAFSSGSCLVAHSRLAESMPEVKHGVNALLGNDADEIAGFLAEVIAKPALAAEIGAAARSTYEREYQPRVVAARLLAMME
ncbi:MAG: hypothetical protein R3E40_11055 [Rhodocyclaceae bacterium]